MSILEPIFNLYVCHQVVSFEHPYDKINKQPHKHDKHHNKCTTLAN